ncbi:SdpI family protein [Lacinutrix jangbogonensis]|uniref:SdpI family protein n=1 Tax=Lacinutrix jangbogonensis TaxID=1469557 RepID=UPI0012E07653|nr:SdpI family protein [Lacinutrix jangbogonensis]
MEHLFNPLSMVAIVFIIVGILTFIFPPKTINTLYGYRTKTSMKNQQTWDFAQVYSSKKMIVIGLVMLLLSLNFIVIDFTGNQIIIIGLIIIGFSVGYLILKTENAIRSEFKES